jgi:outer membrane lipopolysaccharide assembly protein LptE/RlpB
MIDWVNRRTTIFLRVSVLALLVFVSACGYHVTGQTGSRLATGQSLWVSFIGIEIDSPSAQTVLRRALLEECHALRGLQPSGSAAAADLNIKGSLRTYATRPMSYTALDQVREYRLTVEVELELYRKGEVKPLWKGIIQSYQDYPANKDLSLQRSAEEAALTAASHLLAQKFLMSVEQAY